MMTGGTVGQNSTPKINIYQTQGMQDQNDHFYIKIPRVFVPTLNPQDLNNHTAFLHE